MKKKGRVEKMLTVLTNVKHFCPMSSILKNSNASRSVFIANVLKHLPVFLKLTKLNTTLYVMFMNKCYAWIILPTLSFDYLFAVKIHETVFKRYFFVKRKYSVLLLSAEVLNNI